jgi:cyclophilin family peptidyl-prolyl cis-trans isomerase/HEAT repeat protein
MGLALLGCTPSGTRHARDEAGPAAVEAGGSPQARLAEVEDRRIAGGVTEDDLANHDVTVRRRAARALARIGGPTASPPLLTALSDEDIEVVSWAAYGLGGVCRSEPSLASDIVKALVTRAASAPSAGRAADAATARTPFDSEFAIARALGRCASDEAEKTLEVWLSGPRPRASYAAVALGDVASKKKTLSETTQLALLAAAAPSLSSPPLAEALHPFGRLEHPLASAVDRLLEVARLGLSEAGPARMFAVRALSRAGAGAAPELARVLSHADTFAPAERAEAARGLGRLGEAGQRALVETLASIAPARDALATAALGTALFGPMRVALENVTSASTQGAKKLLYDFTSLAVPGGAPATIARRAVALRCRAAALLVNGAAEDPLLLRCDPEEGGEIGQRAQLDVLGRRPLRGRRLALLRTLLASPHVRVREAAIDLLGGHSEVEDVSRMIAAALSAEPAGLVATAAQFVVSHPDRLGTAAKGMTPDVATELEKALERKFAPDDVETVSALIEAAGVAHLTAATPKLESYCGHPNPTLRDHAARALSLLRGSKTACNAAVAPPDPARELDHLVTGELRIKLETDAGDLVVSLDPSAAPVAVTRFADLTREGFYDGIVVHRVVPGFVVQFGDPGADGFGGPGREPLRCETSPLPFERLRVGVALAGRDTGSSQMFITLARYPHLDGEYALVGQASGDWDAVAEGDVIRRATLAP